MKKLKSLYLVITLCVFFTTCENHDDKIMVSSVTINEGDLSILPGTEVPLYVTILPENAANPNIIWESDTPAVAEVDHNGMVTAISEGTAVIKAIAQDGSGKFGCITVTVSTLNSIPVNTVTINSDDFSLVVGDTRSLSATVAPANAANKNIKWESDDTAVATVTYNTFTNTSAQIRAISKGTTFIKAIALDGSDAYHGIQIIVLPRSVDTVTINGGNFILNLGNSTTLTVTVLPDFASDKRIQWESNDTAVAVIDAMSGTITGISAGTAIITATTLDGSNKYDSVQITVALQVDSLTINEGNQFLSAGGSQQLSVTIAPETASNKNINWASSNNSIATVDQNGMVTAAYTSGTAAIIATATDGSRASGSVSVTVSGGTVMTAQEIFNALKGQKAVTNGWADRYNNGEGLYYANPTNPVIINDTVYPVPSLKRQAFTDAINDTNAQFIIVSGDIDFSDGKINDDDKSYFDQFNTNPPYGRINKDISFNVASNTTIIGINNARFMFGGLTIRNGAQNIIIRNVTFYDAHGSTDNDTSKPGYSESKAGATALQIENNPGGSGIWVDHCKFTDGTCEDMTRNYNHDGAFDIKYGRFITASWNEFTNHDKVMLVGSSDAYLNVTERQITLHHNYFHYATQRMPRTRGTQMHVYNNYYNDIGVPGNNGYAMGPGVNAQFIVENNYFGSIRSNRVVDWYDSADYPAIVWSTGNNKTVDRSRFDMSGGKKPWEPAYIFALEPNDGLPISVPDNAGPILVFRK